MKGAVEGFYREDSMRMGLERCDDGEAACWRWRSISQMSLPVLAVFVPENCRRRSCILCTHHVTTAENEYESSIIQSFHLFLHLCCRSPIFSFLFKQRSLCIVFIWEL